jgi:hypothetical protein
MLLHSYSFETVCGRKYSEGNSDWMDGFHGLELNRTIIDDFLMCDGFLRNGKLEGIELN